MQIDANDGGTHINVLCAVLCCYGCALVLCCVVLCCALAMVVLCYAVAVVVAVGYVLCAMCYVVCTTLSISVSASVKGLCGRFLMRCSAQAWELLVLPQTSHFLRW